MVQRVWRKVEITSSEAGNWASYLALPERLVAELCKESSYLIHQEPTRVISRCESVGCASERVIVTPRSPPPPPHTGVQLTHSSITDLLDSLIWPTVFYLNYHLSAELFRVADIEFHSGILSARQEKCLGAWRGNYIVPSSLFLPSSSHFYLLHYPMPT